MSRRSHSVESRGSGRSRGSRESRDSRLSSSAGPKKGAREGARADAAPAAPQKHFALRTRSAANTRVPAAQPVRTYTAEEMEAALRDYVEVPPTAWAAVPSGTHIHYLSRITGFRGECVTGATARETVSFRLRRLESSYARASFFVVPHAEIEHLWVRVSAEGQVLHSQLVAVAATVNQLIVQLAEVRRRLDARDGRSHA